MQHLLVIFFSNVVVLLVIAKCNIFSYVFLFSFSNVVVLLVIAECNIFSYVFLVMLLYFW